MHERHNPIFDYNVSSKGKWANWPRFLLILNARMAHHWVIIDSTTKFEVNPMTNFVKIKGALIKV